MKIVVTGALGHIGSHLIRDLPARIPGCEIVMVDSMMMQRYASLFNLPAIARYRFVEGDVTSLDLARVFEGARAVVHLAAITDAAGTLDKADTIEANNFQGTRKVAEACIAAGARLISLSSTSVYGTQKNVVAEDCAADDLKPQSPYARTKLDEERLVRELVEKKGLRAATFSFGTIFGVSPGMRFHTSVNRFCWQAVMGEPLTVWRTAYDQKRPYLDLADAGRAIAFAIDKDLFDGRIYNILTLNATVRQLVETIKEFVPALKMKSVDSPLMNQFSYEVSAQRIRDQGFAFTGDLKRGIGDSIALLAASAGGLPAFG